MIFWCNCKCGFRFCLCALLSQSHVCWVISSQLMHVYPGIVEYKFIFISYYTNYFLSTYFQYPDIIYGCLNNIMLVKNFVGGPHYWGCSYATSVDVIPGVACVHHSSQPVRFTPVLIHAVLWVSLVHRCFAYHGNDRTFSFVQ